MNRPASRPAPSARSAFRRFQAISTRWNDNDVFGHVNNVVYYSFFDTAVTSFLLERRLIDIAASRGIFIVVETMCRFSREIAFPDAVTVGLRVAHIGQTSVRYELGVFRNEENEAAAEGHFVHVYVDRATMRPMPITEAGRAALAELTLAD
jgi:acyl-CoA thioester hydrolase